MDMPRSSQLWPDVQPKAARRLMLAGVEAFALRGYHATTTRDIASAAGMSPAALYVHFPAKSALLFAISQSGHQQTLDLVQSRAAGAGSPADRMRDLVEQFVIWHARRHTVAKVVQYELNALSSREYEIIAQLRRRIERLVRDLVTEGVQTGEFTVDQPRMATRAVLSLGVDVARWYDESTRHSPVALGEAYAQLVLRMLGNVPG